MKVMNQKGVCLMKLKEAIKIDQILGRTIPSDIPEQLSQKYLSESRGEYIPIAEMDIIHFVRAFNKRERTIKEENTKMLLQILKDLDPKMVN